VNRNVCLSVLSACALLLTSCARPMSDFGFKQEKINMAPTKVAFENKSQQSDKYEWDFGDGTTSTDVSPTHEYKASGDFTITLKAKKGKKVSSKDAKITIEAPKECLVELETEYGNMLILLNNATPLHRDNFLKLAEQGFYDGLLFHRVINGFMIQGGDPSSREAVVDQNLGGGDPGYTVPAEFVDTLGHIKGMLAAARTSDAVNPQKRSSGSQFYIVQGKPVNDAMLDRIEGQKGFRYTKEQRAAYTQLGGTPFLDRDYTVFGRVIRGLDVIDKIAAVETSRGDRPKVNLKMKMKVIK
jgi:cyclophilin family peptidyl-prolyl cis-trans isomerase